MTTAQWHVTVQHYIPSNNWLLVTKQPIPEQCTKIPQLPDNTSFVFKLDRTVSLVNAKINYGSRRAASCYVT